jgi:3-methyladenine DNA glycosylase/8-oxoguanine DNA glycosylase
VKTSGASLRTRHTIAAPPGFHFWRTVRSHGWYDLPPFSADPAARQLERLLRLADGTLVLAATTGAGRGISCRLTASLPLSPAQRREAIAQVRTCFRLDEDFSAFHREARRHPHYRWIASSGSGRLLRAPTAFEDIVKMLCTTNCSWTLTGIMTRNLVEAYGECLGDGRYSFPTPAAIAGAGERELRTVVKAGYRAPYLLRFAEEVATGRRNVESLRNSPLSSDQLFDELRTIRGVGPYAAGNMLRLLGRYDYLALDSWVRGQYSTLHAGGRRVSDRTIERHYRPYGSWRGLMFWLEMTRSWHEQKFPAKSGTTEGKSGE